MAVFSNTQRQQLFIDSQKYGPMPAGVYMSAECLKNDVEFHSYIKGVNIFIQDSIITMNNPQSI